MVVKTFFPLKKQFAKFHLEVLVVFVVLVVSSVNKRTTPFLKNSIPTLRHPHPDPGL